MLAAVAHYSQTYGVEPSVALRKPFSQVLAAYYLASATGGGGEVAPAAAIGKEPSYTRSESDGGTRVNEQAVIPLNQLGPNTTTKLEDLIAGFK